MSEYSCERCGYIGSFNILRGNSKDSSYLKCSKCGYDHFIRLSFDGV